MSTDVTLRERVNPLARFMGLERHEAAAVGWSFLLFFCVLSSYLMLRPIREEMGVVSGPGTIPYLFTGTFVVMLLATPLFGVIASRFPRRTFLPWVYLFFVANILIFWPAFRYVIENDIDYVWLARVFFVWVSVFNLYVVSVFWSFMADIYTSDQARRLFGMISAGGSIGSLAGGAVTSALVMTIEFQNLFPVSALLLGLAVVSIGRLRRWYEEEHPDAGTGDLASLKPLGGDALAGVRVVFTSRYFAVIAISLLIANLLGTALYMFRAQLIEQAIADQNARVQFFSNINVAISVLAALAQLFAVRHVVQKLGVGVSLSLLPVVSIAGFAILALDPTLMVVAYLEIVRRGLGFGFTKPTTDMLYSVVTPEEKYKVKNFIDTAIYRGGDLVGTWTIKALSALGIAGTSLAILPFALLWTFAAFWLGRDYRRRDRAVSNDTEHEKHDSSAPHGRNSL